MKAEHILLKGTLTVAFKWPGMPKALTCGYSFFAISK